jgi:hypothetical protein
MKRSTVLFLALGLLIPALTVLAKGGFDYITVEGPGITGEITITNPALTQDFFAFADLSKGSIEAPADPGQGYEVTRVYVVDNRGQPFDKLHYYPYTGYVYYDGIVNGSSEYDGKWYAADPAAEARGFRLSWWPCYWLVSSPRIEWHPCEKRRERRAAPAMMYHLSINTSLFSSYASTSTLPCSKLTSPE